MVARERFAPVGKNTDKPPIGKVRPDLAFGQINQPVPFQGRFQHQRRRIEGQLPIHPDIKRSALLLELPSIEAAMDREPQIDAVVAGQVMRRLRRRALGKVEWRADHRHPQFRPDRDRDHIPGYLLAHANAGVEALGHDVGQAVVDDDLDLDVGILADEPGDSRPEDGFGRIPRW
jgi:hypothetical protein